MDYELIILHALVEIVMDEDASEHLKELRKLQAPPELTGRRRRHDGYDAPASEGRRVR